MNRGNSTILLMLMLIFWITTLAVSQVPDSTVELRELILLLEENNPQLQSAYQVVEANKARVPQAGALPDPMISFNILNLPVSTLVFDQEAMTGKQIAFSQKFPFPGKLGLKEDIARENALAAQARYEELRNELVQNLKNLYYQLYFIDKSIEVVNRNTQIIKQFINIVETKYAVGKGLQQDVLRAQVQLSKMIDRQITLKQRRVELVSRINALLNREPDSAVGYPVELNFKPLQFTYDSLRSLADENRPLLKVWQAFIRQSKKKVKLARKEYLPDFKVAIAYTQRDVLKTGRGGADFISGLVTIDVPLYFWRKQRKQVQENQYMQISLENRYQDVRNKVYSEIQNVLSSVQKNGELVDLYENGIIPQATQSLNSAIAGYQTNKVDFLTLLNNEIVLFNYELDFYRYLSSYYKDIAKLERLVGIELMNENKK